MGDYNRDYGSAHNPGNAELQLGRKREEYSVSIPVTEQGDSPYRSALLTGTLEATNERYAHQSLRHWRQL